MLNCGEENKGWVEIQAKALKKLNASDGIHPITRRTLCQLKSTELKKAKSHFFQK
jgi:hypothetical protein